MRFSANRVFGMLWMSTICVASGFGCKPEAEYAAPPPPKVTVATPVQMDVTLYVEEAGYTEAVEMIELRARVEGFLDQACVPDGSDVKAGDPLFIIDKRPFQAELAKVEAAVTVALAEAEDAKAKLLRAQPLRERQAISEEELQEKRAAYLVSQANIKAAEAAFEQAKLELSYCEIKAPVDGRMGDNLIDEGNFVGRGLSTHLGTMIRYDPIYARFNISERDFLELIRLDRENRQKAAADGESQNEPERDSDLRRVVYMALEGEDDFSHEGYLDYVELGIESSTGTFGVRAVFPNPPVPGRSVPDIAPGMTVRVRVPLGTQKGALLIPEAAVAADQKGRFAKVVNSENKVERRDLRLGIKVADLIVVEDGIKPDDRVIVGNLQRARESVPVEIEETKTLEPPTAAVLPPPTFTKPLENDPGLRRLERAESVPSEPAPAGTTPAKPVPAESTPAESRVPARKPLGESPPATSPAPPSPPAASSPPETPDKPSTGPPAASGQETESPVAPTAAPDPS